MLLYQTQMTEVDSLTSIRNPFYIDHRTGFRGICPHLAGFCIAQLKKMDTGVLPERANISYLVFL